MRNIIKATSIALFFVVLGILFWDSKNIHNEGSFTIKRSENIFQIASNLKSQGYINSQLGFVLNALISGDFKKLKAGKYDILKEEPYQSIVDKFKKGQSNPVRISIPPGKTIKDIASILEAGHLVKKSEFIDSALELEGYLYPDDYLISPLESIEDIKKQMLSNFDSKLTSDMRNEIKNQNRTVSQVVTMASILEKEVRSYKDKQIVAGILWKRNDNGLPLEADSTLLYFRVSSHPDVLEKDVDSQYNTYKMAGLPIGPICSPDIESIKAAIYPMHTDYWFYLSAPSGETIFAKTLGQQLINKAKYLTQ